MARDVFQFGNNLQPWEIFFLNETTRKGHFDARRIGLTGVMDVSIRSFHEQRLRGRIKLKGAYQWVDFILECAKRERLCGAPV